MKIADNIIPTPKMAGINTFFCTSFFENVVVFIVDFKGQVLIITIVYPCDVTLLPEV
jgi:hypothetical protein